MGRKISVPLDGSELAETALPHATGLAHANGSSIGPSGAGAVGSGLGERPRGRSGSGEPQFPRRAGRSGGASHAGRNPACARGAVAPGITDREITQSAQAARLYGLIRAQPTMLTQVLAEPLERCAYAEAEAILATRLSITARQQALAEGQAMSLEKAVAYTLA